MALKPPSARHASQFVADTERPKSPTLSREVSRVTGFFKVR
jgi:hypothetical protein